MAFVDYLPLLDIVFTMSPLLGKAIAAIDAANSTDPNSVQWDGPSMPKELVYGRKMSDWLTKMEPNPSEVLQLAARSQHICRWEIPRSTYPTGRIGYLQWRTALYSHHAQRAGQILREAGYDPDTIQRVGWLLQKQNLKTNPEMQILEDVVCLVFLENELPEFMSRHPEEKLIHILKKTWKKMSPRGHAAAMDLLPRLPQAEQNLIRKALEC